MEQHNDPPHHRHGFCPFLLNHEFQTFKDSFQFRSDRETLLGLLNLKENYIT